MSDLQKLCDEAMARFNALSPAQQAEHRAGQRESWIRAMAPCEHGDPDWETCPLCRATPPAPKENDRGE